MTAQLSREQLLADIAHAEEKAATLCGACAEDHARLAGYMRMLLAGMDSEPVAWIATFTQKNKPSNSFKNMYMWRCDLDHWVELHELGGFNVDITPLYAAPPAPVAVPDEMTPKQASRAYCGEVRGYRDGWNACRAAMINHATGIAPGVVYETGKATLGSSAMQAEPVTAATMPAGWKLVPVDPTEEMLNAAWVSHGIYHPSAYRTMLAAAPAAPEQEV